MSYTVKVVECYNIMCIFTSTVQNGALCKKWCFDSIGTNPMNYNYHSWVQLLLQCLPMIPYLVQAWACSVITAVHSAWILISGSVSVHRWIKKNHLTPVYVCRELYPQIMQTTYMYLAWDWKQLIRTRNPCQSFPVCVTSWPANSHSSQESQVCTHLLHPKMYHGNFIGLHNWHSKGGYSFSVVG